MTHRDPNEPEETPEEKARREVAERNQRNLIPKDDPEHPDNRGKHNDPQGGFDGRGGGGFDGR